MSFGAMAWAVEQNVRPSEKLVLLMLAYHASDKDGRAFPSIQTLAHETGYDRKTIIWALQRLRKFGLIEDGGERVGATGRVKVHLLGCLNSPVAPPLNGGIAPSNSPKSGTTKQSQKWHLEHISTEHIREQGKKQLSKFIEFLKEDPRFDGLDVEREIECAVAWCRKKNRALTERFLENWLLHVEQADLEEDEEEVTVAEPLYSWEGWTEERRRAFLELCPEANLPPYRWEKLPASMQQEVEARAKEGWSA